MGWNRINKDAPCPICGREKYCMINDNGSAVLCTKKESLHAVGEAGWLHVLDPVRNGGYDPTLLETRFVRFQQNVIKGVADFLSKDLGVSVESIESVGVGFFPAENAWVWAERDELGNVVGLLKRYTSGKKVMEKGSSRGLIYKHPLPNSSKPVLVVEGATDVLAAMDFGYVAVGRPSAESGGKFLLSLLKGRDVIVVGENDGGAGQRGMDKMYTVLSTGCKSIRKVLPPQKYKDLRTWKPTTAEFEQWVNQYSVGKENAFIIEEINMLELSERWVKDVYMKDSIRTFHWLHGDWYTFNGRFYEVMDDKLLDRKLYSYFNQFEIVEHIGKDVRSSRLNPRARFIADLRHALAASVYVQVPKGVYEPFFICSGEHVDVTKTIVFRNGMLDIDTGVLRPLTADIFVTSTLPYDYDPYATCETWNGFVVEAFNNDIASHNLLQEWSGYNMIASNHMQQMLFLFGVPGSGKSTTINMLTSLLGLERTCPLNIDDMTSQFGLEQLIGKYAAIITEERATNHVDADRILQKLKKITGQDMISVARKYKEAVHVRFISRFTYAGNELPKFHDEPQATLRRFLLLFYPNNFYDRPGGPDRLLGQKIENEIQGVANWALMGLQRLLKNGYFTTPELSKEHLEDLRGMSSPLSVMVGELCELGDNPEFVAPIEHLFDLHNKYYTQEGLTPMGGALFRSRLKTVLPKLKRSRRVIAGEQVSVYEGIRIKRAAMKKYLGMVC